MTLRDNLDLVGYHIVGDLLSSTELLDLGVALDEVTRNVHTLSADLRSLLTLERDLPARQRGDVTPEQAGDAVFLVGELQRFGPGFASLIDHPGALATLEVVFGSREFEFHFMNATVKSPFVGSRVAWHRDWPNRYLCGRTSNQVRLMLCLDGMRREEGALQVIRGSHRVGDEAARTSKLRGRTWQEEDIETVECSPGSLIVLSSKIVHGSGPNRSARQRRNILMQWGGPGCGLVGQARELRTGWSPGREA